MIILRDKVKHPPGIFHGVSHIAQSQRDSSTVNGDPTGQTAKFLFIHDDHLSR